VTAVASGPRPSLARPTAFADWTSDVFDFTLNDAEMKAIGALDADRRTGPDPDTFVRP
jgi:2,5-diketo-D-gluconate reductase A